MLPLQLGIPAYIYLPKNTPKSKVVTVTDKQAVETLWDILNYEKLLVEPAMSCSLSAVISGKSESQSDDNIVIIICGGNVAIQDVIQWRTQFGLS